MREIDRYERASLREQLGDMLGWFRTHRIWGTILIVLAIGWVAQIVSPPRPTTPADLVVGDCLYARTSAAMQTGPNARPIGEPGDVEPVVIAGAAERAGCGASHGHEVSAVIGVGSGSGAGSVAATFVLPTPDGTGASAMAPTRSFVQARCEAVFASYVGKPLESSRYETFAVVPSLEQWQAGQRVAVCLVARKDGRWMTSPARGSGE